MEKIERAVEPWIFVAINDSLNDLLEQVRAGGFEARRVRFPPPPFAELWTIYTGGGNFATLVAPRPRSAISKHALDCTRSLGSKYGSVARFSDIPHAFVNSLDLKRWEDLFAVIVAEENVRSALPLRKRGRTEC